MSNNPAIYATAPPPLTAMITHTHPDDEAARGAAREIVSWFIQAAPIAFNYLLLDFYHIPRQKQQLMSEANFISDLIDLERQGAQKPDRLLYLLSDGAGGLYTALYAVMAKRNANLLFISQQDTEADHASP